MAELSPTRIGYLIRDARRQRGLTQQALADELGTSRETVNDLEAGHRELSVDLVNRIAEALERPQPAGGAMHLRIEGEHKLSGSIEVRSSKNAAVALLCASLLNRGRTVLRGIAQIEEVNRILEVLTSIGVSATWSDDRTELELIRPDRLALDRMDVEAARRTRSIIMFLGPLLHDEAAFELPYAGGCNLGTRTVTPHLHALRAFGLDIKATEGSYHARVDLVDGELARTITLTERGDTVTENVLMAAARHPGPTIIRNASSNYMVQDLCFFLQAIGVTVKGIGTTTLRVRGRTSIDTEVEFAPSEDPIEAMSLLTAAIVTGSQLTVKRCPIEFLDVELAILEEMGLRVDLSPEYPADNGNTRLVDITVYPSELRASSDKIHPMPFPGLNIDNLPFFAVIAAVAQGRTMIHDWVYENRAIHLVELTKLGANVQLLDPHRIIVTGPTRWRGQEVISPPALRPAVCLLLAALAARGTSVLRDVYVINRGYEDLPNRLNALGAKIEVFHD
ncbi:MAG: UDP-N-acetylglucosamine 1-carboxyvinyltransferase [Micropruina sp.]|nr:UDP-N-acetylglucosamine 1-carboxyvinyltransferase [Micropruina sp.]